MISGSRNAQNGGGESEWYTLGGRINAAFGAATGYLTSSVSYMKNGQFLKDVKYYASGWSGGSRAMIKTLKVARVAGIVGFAAGEAMDMFALNQEEGSPNKISGTKASVNFGFGLLGIFGGAYGTGASILYFGVDALPGGWDGAGQRMHDFQQRERATLGYYPRD